MGDVRVGAVAGRRLRRGIWSGRTPTWSVSWSNTTVREEHSPPRASTPAVTQWSSVSTAAAPIADVDELALVAAGPPITDGTGFTRLGPLPPLRMDPTTGPVLDHYRELASQRYGQCVTAAEPAWETWAIAVLTRRPWSCDSPTSGSATYASLRVVGEPSPDHHLGDPAAQIRDVLDDLATRCPNRSRGSPWRDAWHGP